MTGKGSADASRGADPPGGGQAAAAGTLYVVATPIGNLADITLRALDTLRVVPLIAAEDTRHTHRLLARHDIATRMTSYHAQSETSRAEALLEHLRGGADLALVTDAGTPAVSDPGRDLVAAWASEGGVVVPIPGPSAVLAAVAGSGVAGPRWTFEGFLPRSGRERRDRLDRIAGDDGGAIVFESPGRMVASLRDIAAACGPDRPGAVCRELTKVHEQIVRATLGDLAADAAAGAIPARGEFVLVVGAWVGAEGRLRADRAGGSPTSETEAGAEALASGQAEVERLVADGVRRSEAARRVSAATGIPRRHLYGRGVRG
jgi:16S rRNA (cytidine1402-2'-O)-methyltransferase